VFHRRLALIEEPAMSLATLALVVSTSLVLAPTVAGTDADPREDLNVLIPYGISLLETKQYAKAVETPAEPEMLKKVLQREKKSLDEFAAEFGDEKAEPLLKMLKSVRGTKPELSEDGTKATFTAEEQPNAKSKIVFIKTGKLWSIKN
jgi:hypothetical protein